MTRLTLHDRCNAFARSKYGQQWPDSIPHVSLTGRWVYGVMSPGANFKNGSRYPGAYPRAFVEKIRTMFPDVPASRILHLFSGSVPRGRWTRIDLHKKAPAHLPSYVKPEIVGSIYDLPALLASHPKRGPFDLVFADPSYPGQGLRLYKTREIDTARAFRAMAAALRPGTHVVWLSTHKPLFRKDQWHQWALITQDRSTGNAIRGAYIFERRAA